VLGDPQDLDEPERGAETAKGRELVGVDPQAAGAVVAGWQRGDLLGLRLGALTAEEALALERPAMTYVRGQLGDRLQRQVARGFRRWRHQTSGHLSGNRFV
jgi:hypothetical protein